jgi:DNA-binding NtrC family response regulator
MGNPFQAVLMDLTVQGGMGGEEAIGHLKKIDPDVKAIVSGGYRNVSIMGNYKEHGFCDVVSKPYRVQDLFEIVQHVINGTEQTRKSSLQNAK